MKDISLDSLLGQPIRLEPIFRERVWGKNSLLPYFADAHVHAPNSPIGEVWFTYIDNRTSLGKPLGELLRLHPEILGTAADPHYPGVCPLLVKLLFTTERLSVQVHPDDAYGAQHHQSLGKTEAWYVMDSQPPGEVAVGFRQTLTAEKLKQSALSGEIETLLDWRKVTKGDVVFTPAGTVHAIGAGLTICEIQENSDITYRLYDYGRPRELHLDHGTAVSDLGPHTHQPQTRTLAPGREELLACDYFRIEKLKPSSAVRISGAPFYQLLICLEGSGTLGSQPCRAGEAFLLAANAPETLLDAPGSEWILTYTSPKPAETIRL
jgi:mannose-6-phosphate isomerase